MIAVPILAFVIWRKLSSGTSAIFGGLNQVNEGAGSVLGGVGAGLDSVGDLLKYTSPSTWGDAIRHAVEDQPENPAKALERVKKLNAALRAAIAKDAKFVWPLRDHSIFDERFINASFGQWRDRIYYQWNHVDYVWVGYGTATVWLGPYSRAAVAAMMSNLQYLVTADNGDQQRWFNVTAGTAYGFIGSGNKKFNPGYRMNRIIQLIMEQFGIVVPRGMVIAKMPKIDFVGERIWPDVGGREFSDGKGRKYVSEPGGVGVAGFPAGFTGNSPLIDPRFTVWLGALESFTDDLWKAIDETRKIHPNLRKALENPRPPMEGDAFMAFGDGFRFTNP